jgi:predicted PurR-regulated permease PerM
MENSDLKWIKIFVGIIAMTIIVIILRELRSIFIPLTFAIFLAFIFAPLNAALYKKKLPKLFAIVIMMAIILIFFALVMFIFYSAIYSLIVEFPKYQEMMAEVINDTYLTLQEWFLKLEVVFSRLPEWFDQSRIISPGSFSVTRFVTSTMGTFLDFAVKLVLTLIFLIFIVAGIDKLGTRLRRVLTEGRNKQTLKLMNNIQQQMEKYFFNKTLISFGTALVGMFFVMIFKVDFVLMSGILIFVLNYIPNFGSFVASAFPVLICFLQYGFGWRLIGITACLTVTQLTFGNIIEPNLMGEKLNLSPIVVLISLIFWGWVWGPVGMILAVPITSSINIIIKEIDETNIVSAVISDE